MNLILPNLFRGIRTCQMPFYAVARGRKTGVFLTWFETKYTIYRFSSFKKCCFKFVPIKIFSTIALRFNRCRPECEAQVKGFTQPIFKKFSTRAEAEEHVLKNCGALELAKSVKRFASDSPSDSGLSSPSEAKRARVTTVADVVAMRKHGQHDFLEDADGFVHVYTDGSCEGNGTSRAIAGLGVYFAEGHVL